MNHIATAENLYSLLQQLREGHADVRCIEIRFSSMQPPYRPDPEAMEELVWFVLGQGVETFTMPNGDVFVVYANDFKPAQKDTFLVHLPVGSGAHMVTHSTDDELRSLMARLQK